MVSIKLSENPTQISLSYPKADGTMEEVLVDLDKEFQVSPTRVSESLYSVVSKWAKWAAVADTLTANVQYLKTQRDKIYMVLSTQIRENWDESKDGKRTENALAEKVKTHPDYMSSCDLLEEASLQLSYAKTVQEGYALLQGVLQTLSANMRAAGEFGGPSPVVIETPVPPSELQNEPEQRKTRVIARVHPKS